MSALNEDLLVTIVDEFLSPFGCDSDFDSDFSFDPEDDRVYFSVIVAERADRLFKEYVAKTFNYSIPNIFMLSLLHEVGHFFTLYTFSKEEIKKARKVKKHIEKELEKNNSDEVYSRYFDLSIEKVATEWAINYYKENTKRCEDFYSKFLQTLKAEYKRLGVTE